MLLEDCPVSVALRVIGGKWKPLVLNELKSGVLRYGELRRRIPEASQKVLTQQLRELEASGVVQRTLVNGTIPGTEYKLTPHGRALRPILERLCQWGEQHRNRLS